MELLTQLGIPAAVAAIVAAAVGAIFQKTTEAGLERYKAGLQEKLEQRKSQLQNELEVKKGELQNGLEVKKSELQNGLETRKSELQNALEVWRAEVQRSFQERERIRVEVVRWSHIRDVVDGLAARV